jgi:hypothetical protein
MSWSAWMSIQDVPHRGGTLAKAPSKRHPLLAAPFALAVWIRRVPLMRDASHIAIRSAPPVPWVSGFWGGQDVKCFQARSPVRGVASLSPEDADCRNAWSSSKTVTCRPSFPRKRNAEESRATHLNQPIFRTKHDPSPPLSQPPAWPPWLGLCTPVPN